jgi:hypothetical protein
MISNDCTMLYLFGILQGTLSCQSSIATRADLDFFAIIKHCSGHPIETSWREQLSLQLFVYVFA